MNPDSVERKLTAILSADVVGYSRLMAEDEEGTVHRLADYRDQVELLVRQHRSRLVDLTGDNFLAEFPTALDAVHCVVEIQRVLKTRNADLPEDRRMEFRIGADMGDIRVEGERIYGDGVNIAARLGGLAEPGDICISGEVHGQVRQKLDLDYEDLGDREVKNISEPVQLRTGCCGALLRPSSAARCLQVGHGVASAGRSRMAGRLRVGLASAIAVTVCMLAGVAAAGPMQLLWGDTHVHTSNSFDAYLTGTMTADPATAYRFASGLPVIHPYHRARVQIRTPLDFLVVADHAENLGVMRYIRERGIPTEDLGLIESVRAWLAERWLRGVVEDDEGMAAFMSFLPQEGPVEEAAANLRDSAIPAAAAMERSVWLDAVQAADAYNQPGTFTTLIGWEWSAIPAGANLHRVVFTNADASVASQFRPWSSLDSNYPEDLWAWLEETAMKTGAEFVAIPHNSNISKGYMFTDTTLRGVPYSEEIARVRARWERVVEATQIKGDSETHPDLSPGDPFADFETYPHYIQNDPPAYVARPGDYVRPALRLGLEIEQRIGFNPYRFGLIGSTDAHTGIASAEEPNFWGKLARDSIPENKQGFARSGGPSGWSMSASGLAAVWAAENTRDAIVAAFRRREVYATTGPRIVVRVFGGWDYEAADAKRSIEEVGYGRGVPMGSVLLAAPDGGAPRFLVHAVHDQTGAHLDRIQLVKGWIDAAGGTHERVFDVAWSGERTAGADGAVPPVGNTVDPKTGTFTNEIGSPRLAAVWRDPKFDASRPAFYYVRVLEIPTPRHSVLDALALGQDPTEMELPWSIQERAYTSPIWYSP